MFAPDDPLAPGAPIFAEAWHAQVLALADTMIRAKHFSASDWAETLGAQLRITQATDDSTDGYYIAALLALEQLSAAHTTLSVEMQTQRKADWKAAYLATPHGDPVRLQAAHKPHSHS